MILRAMALFLILQVGLMQGKEPDAKNTTPHSKHAASKAMMKERTMSGRALTRVVVSAGFAQAFKKPHEWGRNIGGLGKRVGSTFGILVIKNSVQFSIGYLRHEEFGYQPSGKIGFRPRLTYALLSTVRARDTRSHERKWATGKISGDLVSGLVSRLWQPLRLRTFANCSHRLACHWVSMLVLTFFGNSGPKSVIRTGQKDLAWLATHSNHQSCLSDLLTYSVQALPNDLRLFGDWVEVHHDFDSETIHMRDGGLRGGSRFKLSGG